MNILFKPAVDQMLRRCDNEPTGGCGEYLPGNARSGHAERAIKALVRCDSREHAFLVWLIGQGVYGPPGSAGRLCGIDTINMLSAGEQHGADQAYRVDWHYDLDDFQEDYYGEQAFMAEARLAWAGQAQDVHTAVIDVLMYDLRRQLEDMVAALAQHWIDHKRQGGDVLAKVVALNTTALARRVCRITPEIVLEVAEWAHRMQVQARLVLGASNV